MYLLWVDMNELVMLSPRNLLIYTQGSFNLAAFSPKGEHKQEKFLCKNLTVRASVPQVPYTCILKTGLYFSAGRKIGLEYM